MQEFKSNHHNKKGPQYLLEVHAISFQAILK